MPSNPTLQSEFEEDVLSKNKLNVTQKLWFDVGLVKLLIQSHSRANSLFYYAGNCVGGKDTTTIFQKIVIAQLPTHPEFTMGGKSAAEIATPTRAFTPPPVR